MMFRMPLIDQYMRIVLSANRVLRSEMNHMRLPRHQGLMKPPDYQTEGKRTVILSFSHMHHIRLHPIDVGGVAYPSFFSIITHIYK